MIGDVRRARSSEPLNPMQQAVEPSLARPRPRGVSHCVAFFAALAGWAVLVDAASGTRALVAASVYGASLAVMFGVSGLYHVWTWSPARRRVLRRLDHAAIFVLIAGTYTPVCLAL